MNSPVKEIIHKDTSDEKLVEMILNGNTLAFRSLVERHSLYVAGIAARFLLKHEDSRDVVQDTFVRVWKNLVHYDNRVLFTTWLYTIAFRLCLDKLRVKRRRHEISLSDEPADEPERRESEESSIQKIDTATLSRAIRSYSEKLSRVQRQVFILRDLQDLPVVEVCRITGYDTVKVKTNLYHARKFMREKLLKGGYL